MRVKYIGPLTALLTLGAGPATDAAKDAYNKFFHDNQKRVVRVVQAPISGLERFLGGVAYAFEDDPNGYNNLIPTNLDKSRPETVYVKNDGKSKKIPADTIIRLDWYTLGNRKVAKISIDDNVYAYTFREPDGNHYAILDLEGKGIFNRRYRKGEFYDVPDWVANRVNRKNDKK